jgi:hypothetical protein
LKNNKLLERPVHPNNAEFISLKPINLINPVNYFLQKRFEELRVETLA